MLKSRNAQYLFHQFFVSRISIGMQKSHRCPSNSLCHQLSCDPPHLLLIHRQQHRSIRRQSLRDFHHRFIKRVWLLDIQCKKVGSLLVSDAQQIPKTLRNKQRRPRSAMLQQRICTNCGRQTQLHRWEWVANGCPSHQSSGQNRRRFLRTHRKHPIHDLRLTRINVPIQFQHGRGFIKDQYLSL